MTGSISTYSHVFGVPIIRSEFPNKKPESRTRTGTRIRSFMWITAIWEEHFHSSSLCFRWSRNQSILYCYVGIANIEKVEYFFLANKARLIVGYWHRLFMLSAEQHVNLGGQQWICILRSLCDVFIRLNDFTSSECILPEWNSHSMSMQSLSHKHSSPHWRTVASIVYA